MPAREAMCIVVLPALWTLTMIFASAFARRAGAVWVGAAVLGAYLIAHAGLFGWPTMPPSPARHGVAWAGVVGAMGGALIVAMRGKRWGGWIVRAMCVAAGMGLVGWKRFNIEREWSAAELVAWGAMCVGAMVVWGAMDTLARSHHSRRAGTQGGGIGGGTQDAWLVAAAVVGLSAPIVVIVGAAMGEGQALGALAVALVVGAIGAVWTGRVEIGAVGVGVMVMIAASMWWSAVMWASLPWWMAVGFCAAPVAGLVGDAPFVRERRGWVRTVARVVAVCAVAAAVGGPSAVRELLAHWAEYGM